MLGLILAFAIGIFCIAGIAAGGYKAIFVGFDPASDEDSAQLQFDRLLIIGTWEAKKYFPADEMDGAADEGIAGMTISGTTTYESGGSFSFNGSFVLHLNDRPDATFIYGQTGTWSFDFDDGRRYIHYKVSDATIEPLNFVAGQAARNDPATIEAMRRDLLQDSSSEVLDLSSSELRTRDVASGIEMTETRK